ncbi:hypothetical protein [Streptomyces alkaliphilus]|uniref:Uncharacterized protein n=1 Tax=Streptomyces alkaliphilus TaxID=1472722 RepID=A0A7W3TFL5_9ACTN|nr:hypothetical protein [Streptomyces alkaliphilus]MBB0245939.1 hypothetical protein [Streptomyces alkaliphilus]
MSVRDRRRRRRHRRRERLRDLGWFLLMALLGTVGCAALITGLWVIGQGS